MNQVAQISNSVRRHLADALAIAPNSEIFLEELVDWAEDNCLPIVADPEGDIDHAREIIRSMASACHEFLEECEELGEHLED